jgi:hypothetical protein
MDKHEALRRLDSLIWCFECSIAVQEGNLKHVQVTKEFMRNLNCAMSMLANQIEGMDGGEG